SALWREELVGRPGWAPDETEGCCEAASIPRHEVVPDPIRRPLIWGGLQSGPRRRVAFSRLQSMLAIRHSGGTKLEQSHGGPEGFPGEIRHREWPQAPGTAG